MTRFAVGIGSNQGDRLQHLLAAIEVLEPSAISALYETEPVGGPEQDPFLNAVVLVDSDLDPLAFLDRLQAIEAAAGRERSVRWGPRTLDLDIIATDAGSIRDERLTVPHPRAAEREFVLRPLVDVWPDAELGDGRTAATALNAVDDQGVDLLARDWAPPDRWRANSLLAVQFVLFLAAAVALASDGALPDGEATGPGILGAVLAMLGLFIAFVASRRLGAAMTASPVPKANAQLVVSGPFRYARHPIYGGVVLVIAGTALFLDSVNGLIAAAVLGAFFWFKTGYEERQLRMRFSGYSAYRQVVRRRLIPFLI